MPSSFDTRALRIIQIDPVSRFLNGAASIGDGGTGLQGRNRRRGIGDSDKPGGRIQRRQRGASRRDERHRSRKQKFHMMNLACPYRVVRFQS